MVMYLVNIVLGLITALFMLLFTNVLFGIKVIRRNMIYYTIILGIFAGINTDILVYFNIESIKTLILFIFFIIITTLLLKHEIWKSLIAFCIITIITMIGSSIVYLILNSSFLHSDLTAKSNIGLLLLSNVFLYIFYLLVIQIIRTFAVVLLFPAESRSKAYYSTALNVFFVTVIIVTTFLVFYYNAYNNSSSKGNYISNIIGILVIIITLISSFYLLYTMMTTRSKLETSVQDLEYQKISNITLESLLNDIRAYKHNYTNVINIINGLAESDNIVRLREYVKEISSDTIRTSMKQLVLDNVKNAELLAMFSSKIDYAHNNDVDLNLAIKDEISDINFKMSKLCEALGILIDNAIEAAKESQERFVIIIAGKNDDGVYFCVRNSTRNYIQINDTKPLKSDMFQKGYSTKGSEHGLGLWIIKEMVAKYPQLSLDASIQKYEEQYKISITLIINANKR